MADIKPFDVPRFKLDGLSLTMEWGTTKPEWESAGRILGKLNKANTFWIGDWHIAGVSAGFTRGDLYDEAERITGLDRETLYQAVNLCKHVLGAQRRMDLSPSHHVAVAALPPAQQEKFLEQAVANKWSHKKLRDVVQGRFSPEPEEIEMSESPLVRGIRYFIAGANEFRDIDEFATVIAAIDELATRGQRTDFPKQKS